MPRSMVRANTGALVALALSLAAASASAETLNEALATAYANNPTLQAARAQLRQIDEQVPQALAELAPHRGCRGQHRCGMGRRRVQGRPRQHGYARAEVGGAQCDPADLSRRPHRRPARPGRKPGERRPRPADRRGAADPAAGRDRLCRRAARYPGARPHEQQPGRDRRAAEGDARALRRRRGHEDRRRPGRVAPGARHLRPDAGPGQPDVVARRLPAGHRHGCPESWRFPISRAGCRAARRRRSRCPRTRRSWPRPFSWSGRRAMAPTWCSANCCRRFH